MLIESQLFVNSNTNYQVILVLESNNNSTGANDEDDNIINHAPAFYRAR